jgi:parallel beta-helix repeat protein
MYAGIMSRYRTIIIAVVILVTVSFNLLPTEVSSYSTPNTGIDWNMDELVAHSSGAITGSSPNFVVHESITVSKEDTLRINLGEIIKFDLNCVLSVNGILKAIGTDDNKITFTSNQGSPEQGDWQGIRFNDDSIDHECIIEHCIVEYANTGIHCERSSPIIVNNIIRKNSNPINGGTSEGNIVCNNYASPNISNNTIELSENFGILIKHSSKPNILDNNILNNEHGGILCSRGADAFISRNDISHNGYGFEVFLADPIITFNTLYDNEFDAFYGATSCNSTLSNNVIENSNVFDIHLRKNSNVILLNTEFDDGNVMIEDDTSSLTVKWNIDVKVTDKNDSAIEDAHVKIYDAQNNEVYDGLTDNNGYVRDIVCVEYVKTLTTTIYPTPHKVKVSKTGFETTEQQLTVDETKEVSIKLLLPGQVVEPITQFSATPLSDVEPLSVTFTDTSTSYGEIVNWTWDFGDGSISYEQNPMHTYIQSGIYTVSLTVKDSYGSEDTETKIDYITVNDASPHQNGLAKNAILIGIGMGIAAAVLLGIFIGLKRPKVDDEVKGKRAQKTRRKRRPEKWKQPEKTKKKVKGKRYPAKRKKR